MALQDFQFEIVDPLRISESEDREIESSLALPSISNRPILKFSMDHQFQIKNPSMPLDSQSGLHGLLVINQDHKVFLADLLQAV